MHEFCVLCISVFCIKLQIIWIKLTSLEIYLLNMICGRRSTYSNDNTVCICIDKEKKRDSTIEKQSPLSPLAESLLTSSWLAEILELRRVLIIWIALKWRGLYSKRNLVYSIIKRSKCFSFIKSLIYRIWNNNLL